MVSVQFTCEVKNMTVKFKCKRPRCKAIVDHVFTYAPRCPKCGYQMVKAQRDDSAPSAKIPTKKKRGLYDDL